MKLPFTEPCGNGLLRFNNWDGTQLSTTKGEKKKKDRETESPRRGKSQRKGLKKKKSEKGKKKQQSKSE